MLYQLHTIHETKEAECEKDGQKCKVKYLIQKRKVPVRKEAADLLVKLTTAMQKDDSIKHLNTNNQNLSRTQNGMTFNQGSREENVTKNLVKDRDKVMMNKLEKENNSAPDKKLNEKKSDLAGFAYSEGDQQITFRVVDLMLPGDPKNEDDFKEGKAEFDEFIEDVKKELFEEKKVKIKVHLHYRKQMNTDRFNGMVHFYLEEESQAKMLKEKIHMRIFNNYELRTEWFEKKPPKKD